MAATTGFVDNAFVKPTNPKFWNPEITRDTPGDTMLLNCSESIARGALEAGVRVAAMFPGSPLTYVIDNLAFAEAKWPIMHVEWSVNEKVSYEVTLGAAMAGVRALCIMKNVGLNWALDPLSSSQFMGAPGPVLVVADDPGSETTQNEQDSRYLGRFLEIPLLEPSTLQEVKDYVRLAFDLAEELRMPVMVRVMVRTGYERGPVVLGPIAHDLRERPAHFDGDMDRWFYGGAQGFPINYNLRHLRFHGEAPPRRATQVGPLPCLSHVVDRIATLAQHRLDFPEGARVGIITCNLAHSEVLDALARLDRRKAVAVLKLATSWPLPIALLTRMLTELETVLVVEEIEPFLEEQVRALCADLPQHARVRGKQSGDLPVGGEITRDQIGTALERLLGASYHLEAPPQRREVVQQLMDHELGFYTPPKFCPGCPEHAALYGLKMALIKEKLWGRVVYGGDVGCHEMAAYEPFHMVHCGISMGAGMMLVAGIQKARGTDKKVIAYIGDGTFFHAGLPALANAVYNQVNLLLVVMDNRTIAETGHQPHPGAFGVTAAGHKTKVVDIAAVARAMQCDYVGVTNAFDVEECRHVFREALRVEGVSVVVARGTCALLIERQVKEGVVKT
jgi:indolepyruvate ferredoxin oxidoreductase alpha subunit